MPTCAALAAFKAADGREESGAGMTRVGWFDFVGICSNVAIIDKDCRERDELAVDGLAGGGLGGAAARRGHPRPSAGPERPAAIRPTAAAGVDPLLPGCRRRRPGSRRSHNAIRDPRCPA